MLKAELVKGKIQVKKEDVKDYGFYLNKETIKNLDMMTYNWNVTRDEAINFIINSFYDLLDNSEDNAEKEVMINQESKFSNKVASGLNDLPSSDKQWNDSKDKEDLIANI